MIASYRAYARAVFVVAAALLTGCEAQECCPIGAPAPSRTQTIPTSATVAVGKASEATLLAGNTVTTIAFPVASSGAGSLRLTGAVALAFSSTTTPVSVVSLPGAPIAAVAVTPSATATYATLPTLTFTLASGTPIANESFVLYLADPATGLVLLGICDYTATIAANGIDLSPSTNPLYIPYPANSPPILPITFSASNSVGFELYETPSSS